MVGRRRAHVAVRQARQRLHARHRIAGLHKGVCTGCVRAGRGGLGELGPDKVILVLLFLGVRVELEDIEHDLGILHLLLL